MIDTIFYFVDTEQDYIDNYNDGNVKPYTICFAKDTKCIWKNGIKYGGQFTISDVKDLIDESTEETQKVIDEISDQTTKDIEEALEDINKEKERLNDLLDSLDTTISDRVADLFEDAEWIQENFPQGVVTYDEGWNADIEAYLKTVGLWDEEDGDKTTKWSQIRQAIDSIDQTVASVKQTADGASTAYSKLNQKVKDGTVVTELSSTTAKVDAAEKVIEWMYGGVVTGASDETAYADLVSAAENKKENTSAISNIHTQVQDIKGDYISSTSLLSKVKKNNAEYLSGLEAEATGEDAISRMFANQGDDLAQVVTKLTGDSSEAALETKLGNMQGSVITTANLGTQEVRTSLLAEGSDARATIAAVVNNKTNESEVLIEADNIDFVGSAHFETAFADKIAGYEFITKDKLTGEVDSVIADGNATFNGYVNARELTAGNTDSLHITTIENEVRFMQGENVVGKFVIEDNGLQIYLLGPDGELYKVNFDNWTNTTGTGTTNTWNIYRAYQTGNKYAIKQQLSVYGNNDDIYYTDQAGKTKATFGTSSTTGEYLEKLASQASVLVSGIPNSGSDTGDNNAVILTTVSFYRDVYYNNGVKYTGPNKYATIEYGNNLYFIKGSTTTATVYDYHVHMGNTTTTASDLTNLAFGSSNYYPTTVSTGSNLITYSGKLSRLSGGTNGGTVSSFEV